MDEKYISFQTNNADVYQIDFKTKCRQQDEKYGKQEIAELSLLF